MTALRYGKPLQSGLRQAGRLFGLDLAGLFDDDEAKSDFDPFLQFTSTSKARTGLTMRPQPQSPVTTTLSFIPRAQQVAAPSEVSAPTIETPGAEVPETQKPSGLRELAAQYGQTALFGAQDYRKAKEAGYSDEQIKKYLDENPMMLALSNRPGQEGGFYEQLAKGQVDTSTATSKEYAQKMLEFDPNAEKFASYEYKPTQAFKEAFSYEAPQISTKFGQDPKFFGGEDYTAAKQSGFSDADIKDFLTQNLDLLRGPNVPGGSSEIGQLLKPAEEPRMAPVGYTPSDPGPRPNEYQIGTSAKNPNIEGSENFFGGLDYEAAKAAGKSDREVLDFLNKNLSTLRQQNVPGGGGLYDQIAARVNA